MGLMIRLKAVYVHIPYYFFHINGLLTSYKISRSRAVLLHEPINNFLLGQLLHFKERCIIYYMMGLTLSLTTNPIYIIYPSFFLNSQSCKIPIIVISNGIPLYTTNYMVSQLHLVINAPFLS